MLKRGGSQKWFVSFTLRLREYFSEGMMILVRVSQPFGKIVTKNPIGFSRNESFYNVLATE